MNEYYWFTIFVALGVGYLLNKFGTWKKFCEIWIILSSLVNEMEDIVEMIEKEIPDNIAHQGLYRIDQLCKRALKYLKYVKLFLDNNHIKNDKKKGESECSEE